MTRSLTSNGVILRRIARAGQRLKRLAFAAAAVACLAPGEANAHEIPSAVTVRMLVRQDSSSVRVVVRVPLESIRDIDFPLAGRTPYVDFVRADSLVGQAIATWIVPNIVVWVDGRPVAGKVVLQRLDPRGAQLPVQSITLEAHLAYPVPSTAAVAVEPSFARLGVRTRTVATFANLDGTSQMFEYTGDPGRLRMNPRWYHAAWQFVVLGFEHILDGVDHLLFVLCLVLPFRRLKPLIGVVTAFTVAHSMTLVASSLGWAPDMLWFPPLVEVLVAASIAWMALENIVMAAKGETARLERRWFLAFGFGLIHGFGFAFALKESLQFAGRHLALSLLSFNVGVELGQILVLLVAVPLLGLLYSRVVAERTAIVIISAFITHTAWHWLGDRWTALRQYQVDWSLAGMLPLIRVVMALAIGVGLASLVGRLIQARRGGSPVAEPGPEPELRATSD